jgi:hypothetical protein
MQLLELRSVITNKKKSKKRKEKKKENAPSDQLTLAYQNRFNSGSKQIPLSSNLLFLVVVVVVVVVGGGGVVIVVCEISTEYCSSITNRQRGGHT